MLISKEEYDEVMKKIESYLQKSTELGGFEKLSKKDVKNLKELSLIAEKYEDNNSHYTK